MNALVQVGLFALFMSISWPKVAATQFTTYMTLLNISMTLGQKLAGPMESILSYPLLFAGIGVIHGLTLLFLPWIDPKQCAQLFRSSSEEPSETTSPPPRKS